MRINLKKLGANLPADFLKYANYIYNKRYIGIYYELGNAVWSDGESSSTFNYYCLYNPLINNPYILIALDRLGLKFYDFGADEMVGDYYLIVDRKYDCSLHLIQILRQSQTHHHY